MAAETQTQPTLQQRGLHEFKELAIITIYLYITLGAVIVMKAAVLETHGMPVVPLGTAAIKAVLLAKFVLIGRAMKIGDRFTTRPLIWQTLHKALAFLVLLLLLTTVEVAIVGLFHGQSIASSLGELYGAKLAETAAGTLIVLMVLIPYFAFHLVDETLGEGSLARMFLVARNPPARP